MFIFGFLHIVTSVGLKGGSFQSILWLVYLNLSVFVVEMKSWLIFTPHGVLFSPMMSGRSGGWREIFFSRLYLGIRKV